MKGYAYVHLHPGLLAPSQLFQVRPDPGHVLPVPLGQLGEAALQAGNPGTAVAGTATRAGGRRGLEDSEGNVGEPTCSTIIRIYIGENKIIQYQELLWPDIVVRTVYHQ